jgi:hypothetical protein
MKKNMNKNTCTPVCPEMLSRTQMQIRMLHEDKDRKQTQPHVRGRMLGTTNECYPKQMVMPLIYINLSLSFSNDSGDLCGYACTTVS